MKKLSILFLFVASLTYSQSWVDQALSSIEGTQNGMWIDQGQLSVAYMSLNAHRMSKGLAPLDIDLALQWFAMVRVSNMLTEGDLRHNTFNHTKEQRTDTMNAVYESLGFRPIYGFGEILCYVHYNYAEDFVSHYSISPQHMAIIESRKADAVGMASFIDNDGMLWNATIFGVYY